MMHAKTVVVDSCWTLVGSANMDKRSVKLNEENIIGINDPRFAREVEAGLETDFTRSEEIALETFRQRGPATRIAERLSRLLIEQY
jgi:cardiolipin synthase